MGSWPPETGPPPTLPILRPQVLVSTRRAHPLGHAFLWRLDLRSRVCTASSHRLCGTWHVS